MINEENGLENRGNSIEDRILIMNEELRYNYGL